MMSTENWTMVDYSSTANAAQAMAAEHNTREAWIAAAEAWEAYADFALSQDVNAWYQGEMARTNARTCRSRAEDLTARSIGEGWTRTDARHYTHSTGALVAKSPSGRWQAFTAGKQAVRTGGGRNVKLFGSPERAATAALAG